MACSQFKGPEEIGNSGLEASRRRVRLRGDMRCMRVRECEECEEYKARGLREYEMNKGHNMLGIPSVTQILSV
jgi:hypothetical protein